MTVELRHQVLRSPWGGYDAPELPIGIWFARATSIGDGTSGQHLVVLQFQPTSTPLRDSNIYSCEQLTITRRRSSGTISFVVEVQSRNLGFDVNLEAGIGSQGDLPFAWVMVGPQAVGPTTEVASVPPEVLRTPLRWMLGQQVSTAQETGVEVVMDNIDLSEVDIVGAGYIWGSRSRSVEGGPQRPLRGVW